MLPTLVASNPPPDFQPAYRNLLSARKGYATVPEQKEQCRTLIQYCQDLLLNVVGRPVSQGQHAKVASGGIRALAVEGACAAVRLVVHQLNQTSFTWRLLHQSEIHKSVQATEEALLTAFTKLKINGLMDHQLRADIGMAREQDHFVYSSHLETLLSNENKLSEVLENDGRERRRSQELIVALTKYLQQNSPKSPSDTIYNFIVHARNTLLKLSGTTSTEIPKWALTSFDVAFDPADYNDRLGRGSFGKTCRGNWDGMAVVVKEMSWTEAERVNRGNLNFIRAEMTKWHELSHPNVLTFHGACIEASRPFLVIPSSPGNILDYLRGNPQSDRLTMLGDISQGLAYLHTHDIVHGKLKASNILVNTSGQVLLADYGLHALVGSTPTRWNAPEVITGGSPTQAADIYSLAMAAFEIFTDAMPFTGMTDDEVFSSVVNEHQQLTRPANMTDSLWSLIENCWSSQPSSRPSSDTILVELRTIQMQFNALSDLDEIFGSFPNISLQLGGNPTHSPAASTIRDRTSIQSHKSSSPLTPTSPLSPASTISPALTRRSTSGSSGHSADPPTTPPTLGTTVSPTEHYVLTQLAAVENWLCGDGHVVPDEKMPDLSILEKFLLNPSHSEVHSHVLFDFITLCTSESGRAAMRSHPGLVSAMIELLDHEPPIATKALKCLANLSLADNSADLLSHPRFFSGLSTILGEADSITQKMFAAECIQNLSRSKEGCAAISLYPHVLRVLAFNLAQHIPDTMRQYIITTVANVSECDGQKLVISLPDIVNQLTIHLSARFCWKIRTETSRCFARLVNDVSTQKTIIAQPGFLRACALTLQESMRGTDRDLNSDCCLSLQEYLARCLATLSKSELISHHAIAHENILMSSLTMVCPLDNGIHSKLGDYVSVCLANLSHSTLGRQALRNDTVNKTLRSMQKHGSSVAQANAKLAIKNIKRVTTLFTPLQ